MLTAGAAVSFSGKSQFTDFCVQTGQIKVRFLSKSQISKANIVNNAKNPRNIVHLEVVSIQGFIVYFWPLTKVSSLAIKPQKMSEKSQILSWE